MTFNYTYTQSYALRLRRLYSLQLVRRHIDVWKININTSTLTELLSCMSDPIKCRQWTKMQTIKKEGVCITRYYYSDLLKMPRPIAIYLNYEPHIYIFCVYSAIVKIASWNVTRRCLYAHVPYCTVSLCLIRFKDYHELWNSCALGFWTNRQKLILSIPIFRVRLMTAVVPFTNMV